MLVDCWMENRITGYRNDKNSIAVVKLVLQLQTQLGYVSGVTMGYRLS